MKLSIITINYNNAKGLKKTIDSVINQTYKGFEYIVIDGASNDGSVDVIKDYESKIDYWVSQKDNGIYHAMNKGILKASGEYLLFLNSGDWFIDSEILKNTIGSVERAEIVYADGYIEKEEGSRMLIKIPEMPGLKFFSKTSLFHPSSFIKRQLFNQFGLYNEHNKIVSDWEFFIKTMLIHKVSYKKIPYVISVIEENGISRNPEFADLLKNEIKTTLAKYFTEAELETAKSNKITQVEYNKKDLFTRFLNFLKLKK